MPKQHTTVAETGKRFSLNNALLILSLAGLLFSGLWWFFIGVNKSSETPEAASLKTVEIVSWSSTPGEFYSVGTFRPTEK